MLWIVGMTPFDSICYGLTTMSTGGFATSDDGILAYNSVAIKAVFCVFMLLGSINFSMIFQAVQGNFKTLRRNTVLKWFLLIIVFATAGMSFSIWHSGHYHTIADITIDPLFQAISVISSTGLVEPDFAQWGQQVLCLLIILMFIGGCAGSTSGGAKVDRLVICFKNIRNEFFRIMHPNAVLTVRINGKGTPELIVQKAIVFLILYVMVILVSAICLLMLGVSTERAFMSSLEAISNTGLGVDLQGNVADMSSFPMLGKWILATVMLVGRLELYTVLIIFTTTFWRK